MIGVKMIKFISIAAVALATANSMAGDIFQSKSEAMTAAGFKESPQITKSTDSILKSVQAIREIEGINYAGTWIEYYEDGTPYQVVGTTDLYRPKTAIALDHEIIYVSARYSYEELERAREKISDIDILHEGLITSFGIDDFNNAISLKVKPENVDNVLLELIKINIPDDIYDIEETKATPVLFANLDGGQRIVASSRTQTPNTAKFRCTAGFNAIIQGLPVVLTAGHCGALYPTLQDVYFDTHTNPNTTNQGAFLGSFIENKFFNGTDAVLFGNAMSHVQLPRIRTSHNGSSTMNVTSPVDSLQLSRVCSFGGRTGWRCGIVSKVNQTYTVPGNVQITVTDVGFCGGGGDSGGPVVVSGLGNATGIFAGGLNNNASTGTNCGPAFGGSTVPTSFFEPIGHILQAMPGLQILAN